MIAMLVTPNCGRWLAFTLGVILTSAPKLVSPPTCGFSYKISCMSMILSNISNLTDYKPSFSSLKLPI